MNFNRHPHFRLEFNLPFNDFHDLMRQRRRDPDGSPGPDTSFVPTSRSGAALPKKPRGRGRPSTKRDDSTARETTEDAFDGRSPAPATTVTDEAMDEDASEPRASPARSRKATGANKNRGRSPSHTAPLSGPPASSSRKSTSVAAQVAPNLDSDSSLSEPDENNAATKSGGGQVKGEVEDDEEEVAEAEEDDGEEEERAESKEPSGRGGRGRSAPTPVDDEGEDEDGESEQELPRGDFIYVFNDHSAVGSLIQTS